MFRQPQTTPKNHGTQITGTTGTNSRCWCNALITSFVERISIRHFQPKPPQNSGESRDGGQRIIEGKDAKLDRRS